MTVYAIGTLCHIWQGDVIKPGSFHSPGRGPVHGHKKGTVAIPIPVDPALIYI